jgi:hypothetical protein
MTVQDWPFTLYVTAQKNNSDGRSGQSLQYIIAARTASALH